MKEKTTFKFVKRLLLVFIALYFPALAQSVSAQSKILPKGKSIDAVRFDAVIELNRYSPDSLRHDYTIMFVRYWVACD